jgi:chloramphenicol-sensitive protein RarD
MPTRDPRSEHDGARGLAFATGAYAFWGLVPLFWRALGPVPPVEVLAHRVWWSVVFVAGLLVVMGPRLEVAQVLRTPRTLRTLAVSTALISANWGLFIWAVQSGRLVQASLGYYINPLANVLLGVVFLGERLRRGQAIAVAIALLGVVYFVIARGVLPWVSLVLAGSFGLYGLIRKRAPVSALAGLFVETLLVAPLAAGYLIWLSTQGRGAFGHDAKASALLALAGPITAIPLVWFTAAARRLSLATLGFAQYISPTLQLAIAALAFHEPLTRAHAVTFGCIWAALALFTIDGLRSARA